MGKSYIELRAKAEINKINDQIKIEWQSADVIKDLNERKNMWENAKNNPSIVIHITEDIMGVDNMHVPVFGEKNKKFKKDNVVYGDVEKNKKFKKDNVVYGDVDQENLGLIYKLAQSGKTGEAILYLQGCKDFFCFVLTENSSNLLIQTKDRIEIALGKDCMRVDGGSEETIMYNNNIFSVCPQNPIKLRGKVCMVIKNKVNMERMSVLQSEIDKHNVKNPSNQVHYKIIADEVDKTMTLTPDVVKNSEIVQRVIDESKVSGNKLSKHSEYPKNINPFVDYCFNKAVHPGLVRVLGLTATTSDLFVNEGIKKVFGNEVELAISTKVLDVGKGHRDVAKWGQILLEDGVGFEKSINTIIKKVGVTFGNEYYTFLPAMMKNETHGQVAKQAHLIDNEILVISVNQHGVVGRMVGSGNDDFTFVNHRSKLVEETLAVKIADIISITRATKVIVTGYISLCRGVTIQARKDDLKMVGVKVNNSVLLRNGLVINCIGVHENIKVGKLGQNADLIQRLCRGNGYPDPNYKPTVPAKLIGCEKVLKAFTEECNFIKECMDEGKKTGFTTDTNFKKVKEEMGVVEEEAMEYDVDLSAVERRFKVWGNPNCYTKIARLMKLMEPTKIYTRDEFSILAKSVEFASASSAISMMAKSAERGGYSQIFNIGGNTIKMNGDLTEIYNKYFDHTE